MNMETVYLRTAPHIDWLKVQKLARRSGLLVLTFAAGSWITSIRDQASQRPYEVRSTRQLEQVQNVTGPNPIAAVKCERWATKVAKNVAAQAITVAKAQDPDAQVPTMATVPSCPTGQKTATPQRKAP